MSKKKSYMDKDNLLSEGFFNKVSKFFKLLKQVSKEKKLLKNPLIAMQVASLTKQFQAFRDEADKEAKELGIKLIKI